MPAREHVFTETDREAIRKMLQSGMTQERIAYAFSCNQATISRVIAKYRLDYAHKPETDIGQFIARARAHADGDHSSCVGEHAHKDSCGCLRPDCERCWGTE